MKDEVLQKALTADTAIIPRYDIVRPDGTKVAEDVQLVLKNTVLTAGTPLNKQSLLKDTTATAYGKNANAVPDDILLAIRRSVSYCPKLKVRALYGTSIHLQNTRTGVESTHSLDIDSVATIEIGEYGTYKIWGVLNGVRTPEVFIDVDTTKTYPIDIGSFVAYVKVSVDAEIGAIITAHHSAGSEVYGTVGADKTCTLPLFKTGKWSCSGAYLGCMSSTVSFDVTDAMAGTTVDKTISWTRIVVSVASGSIVTASSGSTTKTGESNYGYCVLWVPSAGAWSLTATLNGKTATATAYPQANSTYTIIMNYT